MTPGKLGAALVAAIVIGCLFLENAFPLRSWHRPRSARARRNGVFSFLYAAESLAVGVISLDLSARVRARGYGLFALLKCGAAVRILLTVLAMDLSTYLGHRANHSIPALWRMHRLHHLDNDMDVSTAYRLHPFETPLYMGGHLLLIVALGAAPLEFLIFAVVNTAAQITAHANFRYPARVERLARLFVATPTFHQTHHSRVPEQTNSNYGVVFSFWDRLIGTHTDMPESLSVNIGLDEYPDPNALSVAKMLALPFNP